MRNDAVFIGGATIIFLAGATACVVGVLCGLNKLVYGTWT